MAQVLFMNFSPNKDGNTYRIGEELLKDINHTVMQMSDYKISQYGQVFKDDEMKEVLEKTKNFDTLVIGTPVYWYTVGGLLKTFIDRLYMLPEAEILHGKNLYLFAQGSSPDDATIKSISFLASRVSSLMGMNLMGVVTNSSDGLKILNTLTIKN